MANILGNNGANTLSGTGGDDIIEAGNGNDVVDGGAGSDLISGDNGDDILSGGAGDDQLLGGNGNDTLDGGTGDDLILGGNGNDVVNGGAGSDLISGDNGDDFLSGGAGDDQLLGGNGNDTLDGGTGDDLILGGNGNDVIDGGAGSDVIFAEDGNDTVIHNVTLNVGTFNVYDGGKGQDTLRLVVSAAVYASAAFQSDLAAFENLHPAGSQFFFESINLLVNSFERLEVVIEGPANSAPTGITLSHVAVDENAPGAVVGELSASDPDAGHIANFAIVGGRADLFEIVGNELRVRADAMLDYEAAQSHEITIRVTDSGGLFHEETLTIAVNNVNEKPEAVLLSNATVAENAAGVTVGTLSVLDPDAGDFHSFTVSDARFEVVGSELRLKAGQSLDHEAEPTLSVDVTATDSGGLSRTETLTITVNDVNEAPEAVLLSNATIAENAVGVTVGTLSVLDPDAGDFHSFTVDDARFEVVGGELKLKAGHSLDHETEPTLSVDVTATDSGGLSRTETITISVVNGNDAPNQISLTGNSVNEGVAGATIGTLAAADPDGDVAFTFTVDDSRFEVTDGGVLKLKDGVSLDHETESQVEIFVTAVDAGGAGHTQQFVINVVDGEEATAIDGYIAGATVFADADNDGVLDAGEVSTTTDANGNFILFGGTGPLVMFGGIDISTGLPFSGTMRAPEGSKVVTPLTTLVVAVAEATGQDVAAANDQVLQGLGLAAGIDLAVFDPIAAAVSSDAATQEQGAVAIAAAVQLQNTIVQASSLLTGAGATQADAMTAVVAELAETLVAQVQNNATIDLNDTGVIASVIVTAGATVGADADAVAATAAGAANVIAASNQIVTDASILSGEDLLTTLAQVAAVAQNDSAAALADAGHQGTTEAIAEVETNFTGTNLTDAVGAAPVGNVLGVNGPDTIIGTQNADVLEGFGGDDTLVGLDGVDVLIGGDGDDVLDGGAGVDRAVYGLAAGPITVDLAAGTVSGAGVGSDTLLSVEMVSGGAFGDSFTAVGFGATSPNAGSNGRFNEFEGRGGDDVIIGNGNTRVSYANAAAGVTVDLGLGTGQGSDPGDAAGVGFDTFSGVNFVRGSAFADTLVGSNAGGTQLFEGRGGDDFINGMGGFDVAVYQFDGAGVNVNLAAGTVTGGGDNDTLRSVEAIRGTAFADTFDATGFTATSTNAGSAGTNNTGAAFNEFEGMGGNDTVIGNGNTRIAFYNATAGVTVDLAAGTATGDASVGSDSILGGVTQVSGSAFADTLMGSTTASFVAELFDGRGGDDTLDGRGGFDIAVYNLDPAVTAGISVAVSDTDPAVFTVTGDASVGTDTLIEVESVRGTNFADTFDATGFEGASADLPLGSSFNEFEGLGGDDIIIGNGNTRLSYANAGGAVTVDLAAGVATGGGVGTDSFTGVARVRGSNFNDTLSGDDGNNVLEGQGGNDTLAGRAGFDTLIGGGGDDTFVFATGDGADVINDFVAGAGTPDRIDLTGVAGIEDFADVQALATQVGADTVIDFGGGDVLTLLNVNAAMLHQDDFLL